VTGANGKAVLVLGGGIAGLTTAIEAAEAGCSVVLIEKAPYLGGRVTRMNQYFPKLCPPGCGLEINFRRIKNNPKITVLTLAEVEELSGTPGDYTAVVKLSPRHVTRRARSAETAPGSVRRSGRTISTTGSPGLRRLICLTARLSLPGTSSTAALVTRRAAPASTRASTAP